MSFAFSVTADSLNEAGAMVEHELGLVVAAQPVHTLDRQAVQDTAERFIGILTEPGENECVRVSVTGSLGWRSLDPETGGASDFTSANVSVSAYLAPK